MNSILSFGIPTVVLVLMLAPFFILRKKEGWIGDWRGAFLRWALGIVIWYVLLIIFTKLTSLTWLDLYTDSGVYVFLSILLYFFIWPFFGFNLLKGTKITKNLIFQLFVGLLNLSIGIVLLIFAVLWGMSHIFY
ncbi:MAG: hypothetical protein HN802_03110 [Candidatus Jacksonbacteria bacterium]|jgi:hypothetical protein|nr:hypothetical protein [Candidatus Jacksonbacteria bacterium]MBT6756754.1 hypothetical protein [Candidatus Jacksonbacteria bacterium]MBT7008588.1 hypothetical protein [Candidatus Jacksonbacteria bacterium]MBT7338663.1 hypothetical protein [Candidatus Jacksonbacteria bacterium]